MNEELKELDSKVYSIIDNSSDKIRANQALEYYLNGKGNVLSILELALHEAIEGNWENYQVLRKAFDMDCFASGLSNFSAVTFCVTAGLFSQISKRDNTAQKGWKHLYVIKMSNGSVKIGIACDTKRRFSAIQSSSGMSIEDHWESELIDNAYKHEQLLHKKYKDKRLNGEYFDIDFSEAVSSAIQQVAMIGG